MAVPDPEDVSACIVWLRRSFHLSDVRAAEMLVPLACTEEELRPVLERMRLEGRLRLSRDRGWEVSGSR